MKAASLKAWRRQAVAAAAGAMVLALVPAMAPVRAADDAPAPAPALALTDLGQALLRPASGPNAVVSPVATAVALGLVQAGANGAAETEIEALFGSGRNGARALRQTLPALLRQMQGEGTTGGSAAASPLTLAARMWVDNAAAPAVPAAYTQRLVSRWQADALRVSFAKSEATRGQINSWTADHTGGRIKDLLPPGSVSPATQMALTSAVYFRSPWEKPFDPTQTVARPFKTAAGTAKDVPTMVDERGVLQARIDGHLVMEIPFGVVGVAGAASAAGVSPGGSRAGFALLVAVPDESAAGAAAPAPFTGTQLARWRAALQPLKCELALPRFAIAPQSGSLKTVLQGLGVKTVFTDAADLRPMLGRQARQMHLEDLHHAAGITVDEEGGVAVAAAAATVRSKSLALPVPPCAVDRAFAFALVHQASGAPVFVGRVGDPVRSE